MKVFITIFILSIFISGCRKPDPNPELKDPIYQYIQKQLAKYEKELKFNEGERDRIKKQIEALNSHDPTIKIRWKTYYMNERERIKAAQQADFAKIALEKRKKVVKLRYLEAFKRNKEDSWIDENEFSAFKSRVENNEFLTIPE